MNLMASWRAACLVVALLSCRNDKAHTPALRTDPTGLKELVDLPYGTGPVRWEVRLDAPGGCGWVPGPTDSELLACVTLDATGWTTLEAKTGPSTAKGLVRVPEGVAEAIFDATQLGELPRDDDVRLVEGPRVDLSHVSRRAYRGEGVRWGDTLVLRLGTQ
jgi:hypothetical protein